MPSEYKPGFFECQEHRFITRRRLDALVHNMDAHPLDFQGEIFKCRKRIFAAYPEFYPSGVPGLPAELEIDEDDDEDAEV